MELIKLATEDMMGKRFDLELPPVKSGFVAGGAVRCWFVGTEQLQDVDVFFLSQATLDKYKEALIGLGFEIKSDYDKAITLINSKGLKVQLVKRYYQSIADAFKSFDYHLCQFAVWKDDNGVDEIWSTKQAIISVLRKRLSVNFIQDGFQLDSLRRAFKYFEKGYKPCAGAIMSLAIGLGLDANKASNQIQFYPDGVSKRIARFD